MTVFECLARAVPEMRTSNTDVDRVAYGRDLWPRHHLAVRSGHVDAHRPAGIVWPTSTAEVAKIVSWANATRTPIVPFGAGSGVCAGILPNDGVIVIDLKRMSRWRHLDASARTLDVEAGQMGLTLEDDLQRRALTLGHFPSSIGCSTVGGWIAARSAGQCSGRYGKIEDMVLALECVTGDGEIVTLNHRTSGPNLIPLIVGSEGTMAIVTSATLRLHAKPTVRSFGAFSFPSTEHGWEAMRVLFQAGLRPAVSRLYDPFDAMLARHSAAKSTTGAARKEPAPPGLGASILRNLLRKPGLMNDLLDGTLGQKVLGGSLVILIFEGNDETPERDMEQARTLFASMRATYEGEGPARHWMQHRYSVSYRQAPVFASGLFSDTMEVAAPWSRLRDVYDGVRHALGEHVFVMAHLSHAYPDGCCIYFSFAGTAAKTQDAAEWDARCETTYDRAWKAAMGAVIAAGGTLAHHHGVGRSKAPRMMDELGHGGVETVRALMQAFDPTRVMNPGNLLPASEPGAATKRDHGAWATKNNVILDAQSLLVEVSAQTTLHALETELATHALTLGVALEGQAESTIGAWLARGAKGAASSFVDPADHLVAGFIATRRAGFEIEVRPNPRRSVGPDLSALFLGANERFGKFERLWLRVHRSDARRQNLGTPECECDAPLNEGETRLLKRLDSQLNA
jgi:alkyldihydroxyacetonephosphate synthase